MRFLRRIFGGGTDHRQRVRIPIPADAVDVDLTLHVLMDQQVFGAGLVALHDVARTARAYVTAERADSPDAPKRFAAVMTAVQPFRRPPGVALAAVAFAVVDQMKQVNRG
jgi:hypothetical protein